MPEGKKEGLGKVWVAAKKIGIKSLVATRTESWMPISHASIMMYHGVLPPGQVSRDWSHITAADFEAHMKFIRRRYQPVSLDLLVRHLQEHKPLPPRAVVVTFDDGLRNNAEVAVPILRHYGIPATFFAVSGFIGSGRMLWIDRLVLFQRLLAKIEPDQWRELMDSLAREFGINAPASVGGLAETMKHTPFSLKESVVAWLDGHLGEWDARPEAIPYLPMSIAQLRELDADPLFTIGAHTVNHEIISQCELTEARRQIFQGKEDLESMLGHPVIHFAFPNGQRHNINEFGRRLVAEAGFASSCTTIRGNVVKNNNPLDLPRLAIGNESISLDLLRLGLTGLYPALADFADRTQVGERQPAGR